MKKRIKMKIEKIRVHKEFSHMDQYCDECGTKMILKNKSTIIKEDFVGDFILKGFHPICQKCGEEFLTSKMLAELKRMMKARIQELLLKNYSPEVYHYIPIEEIALLEKCSVDDLLNSSE